MADDRFSIRLPDELRNAIKHAAAAEGLKEAAFIKRCITLQLRASGYLADNVQGNVGYSTRLPAAYISEATGLGFSPFEIEQAAGAFFNDATQAAYLDQEGWNDRRYSAFRLQLFSLRLAKSA